MDKARKTALTILIEVNEKGKFANISIKDYLQGSGLEGKDASFVTSLVYGTLENQAFIDTVLGSFAKMGKVNPKIKNILRLGAFQILYLDRVPDFAACDESVKLTVNYGFHGLKGFVNGLLRNISRKKNQILKPQKDSKIPAEESLAYGLPKWLTQMWIYEYGEGAVGDIVSKKGDKNLTTLRPNRKRIQKDDLAKILQEQNIKTLDGIYFENALRAVGIGNIGENPLYKDGLFTVQSESSILVCQILAPKPGDTVLDACSAPGGKAIYIEELMGGKGRVYALDNRNHRVDLIARNIKRMGSQIISSGLKDATIFAGEMEAKMDKVLIDAPCSGWGVLYKKPDIRLRIDKENLETLYELQGRILDNCSSYVKVGGALVYSTCTINPLENQKRIEKFLQTHPEFALEDFSHDLPHELMDARIGKGMVQIFPRRHQIDGFFISKMRRLDK